MDKISFGGLGAVNPSVFLLYYPPNSKHLKTQSIPALACGWVYTKRGTTKNFRSLETFVAECHQLKDLANFTKKFALKWTFCEICLFWSKLFTQKIFQRFGRTFYNMSFNEGNVTNSLEISSKERIDFVEQDDLCKIDIDTKSEMELSEKIIKSNKKKYARFLHTS